MYLLYVKLGKHANQTAINETTRRVVWYLRSSVGVKGFEKHFKEHFGSHSSDHKASGTFIAPFKTGAAISLIQKMKKP